MRPEDTQMDEVDAAIVYWNAIHNLESVLESGHRTKEEIIEDLELYLDELEEEKEYAKSCVEK